MIVVSADASRDSSHRRGHDHDVKTAFSSRIGIILASIAFVLISVGIALNYFVRGEIRFVHVLFALGLLAYVVWFSGRRDGDE
jgi:uncharacterized membrane protein YfcA